MGVGTGGGNFLMGGGGGDALPALNLMMRLFGLA